MNNFCPFIKESCKSDCVFYTHKTRDADGEKTCRLSLAAASLDEYCDMKIRELEDNLPKKN